MMKRTRVLLMLVEVTETDGDERCPITIRPPEGEPQLDRLIKALRPLLEDARRAS